MTDSWKPLAGEEGYPVMNISRTVTRPAKTSAVSRIVLPSCLIPVRHGKQYTETAHGSLTIAVLRAHESRWQEFPVSIVEEIEEHRAYFAGIPSSAGGGA